MRENRKYGLTRGQGRSFYPSRSTLLAVSQLLNGRYAKNYTTLTDKNGKYSLTVLNDSSEVSYSYPAYISKTKAYSDFRTSVDLGATVLQPVTGITVTTNLTYTASVAEGDTVTVENFYSNYQNVAYQFFNLTKNKAVSEVYVQYPNLIIQDVTDLKDKIRITAFSKVNEFKPVDCIITIDSTRQNSASFNLVGLGGIKATYTNSTNSSNLGILYNPQGQFVKKLNYVDSALSFTNLADGSYTLVSMAGSAYFNDVLNLSGLSATGLTEGKDYVLNKVEVKSGVIATAIVSSIPLLDETKFYYTGGNTLFSVNKTSVVAGNYVTLRARLDFKPEYAGKVSGVNLLVDLPGNCSFVNNSVMIGSAIATYVKEGNRIIIPLNNNYAEQVRFCITPTIGGNYAPTGLVKMEVNGKAVTQPLGSASFIAADMSIVVPVQTAKKTIPVSGTAAAFSTVSIYDGMTLIGQTTASGTGAWLMSCELFEAYNLSTHQISAKISTPGGITIQTETKNVEYNISAIEVKTVTMINTAHGPESLSLKEYQTVFDFQHPKESMPPYWYWPSYPDFTFKIDFTNNDTTFVSNVVLYVKTSDNAIVPLKATYDKTKDIWLATGKFNSNSLPVNVSVDYNILNSVSPIDRREMEDSQLAVEKLSEYYKNGFAKIAVIFLGDGNDVNSKLKEELGIDISVDWDHSNDDFYQHQLENMSEQESETYEESLFKELTYLSDSSSMLVNQCYKYLEFNKYFTQQTSYGKNLILKTCEGLSTDSLIAAGFQKSLMSDSSYIYTFYNDQKTVVADFKNNLFIEVSNENKSVSKGANLKSTDDFVQSAKDNIQRFNEIIERINKIADDLISNLKANENKLLTKIDEIDKEIAKAERYLSLSKRPQKILKWNSALLILQKQSACLKFSLKIVQKCSPLLIKAFPAFKYIGIITSAVDDMNTLIKIWYSIPDPCPNDENGVTICRNSATALSVGLVSLVVSDIASNVTADGEIIGGIIASTETAGFSLTATLLGLAQKAITEVGTWVLNNILKKNAIAMLQQNIANLNCNKCDTCPPTKSTHSDRVGSGNGGGKKGHSGSGDTHGVQDPSGYVYEAVSSNRLQGVIATIFFKTTETDMYGDPHEVVTKWDASQFYQVNPDTTDVNGVYAWDVPVGLWQVKYEKPGYETVYSDWLPVPPPQLEINVGMQQLIAPTVKKVRGYEEGVNIAFDKYMKLATMTNQLITVTYNGSNVSGTIRMLNEEEGYAADTAKYVSKVRFIPDQPWTAGDFVTITVKSLVESYVGMKMADDFSQTVVIEKEVKSIAADSTVIVQLNGNKLITVTVSPAAASKGKKVFAHIASSSILSMPFAEAILDNNGQAQFMVKGDLPGATTVQFTVYDVDDLSSVSLVTVNPLPDDAGTMAGSAYVCLGNAGVTYSVPSIAGATSYGWILPDGSEGTSVTNSISVNYTTSAISGNIYVQGHNDWGYGPYSQLAVTVNTIPVAAGPISGNTTVCKGSEATYTVPVISGATSYSWTLPTGATGNSTTNSITVVYGSSSVSGNITVKGHDGCGDGTESSLAISVNTIPVAAGSISGNTTVCKGSEATYTVPVISGATSYSWLLPAGATGNSTTNSITVVYGSSSVSGNITVKGHDGCGDGTESSLAISVNTIPLAAGPISGNTTVCKGSEATYTVPEISGATSYIWSLPAGATGGSTTNSITITYTSNSVSGNVTLKGHNECGDGTESLLAVTVNTIPVAAGPISGHTTVCKGSEATYTVPEIIGATSHIWSLPAGATGNSTTNSITVVYGSSSISGNITAKGHNECGDGTQSSLAVTVNSIPVAAGPISGNTTVCKGSDATYTVPAIIGATSYSWTLPTGATGNSTTNSITATYTSSSVSGNITVKGHNECGDGTESSLAISVNTIPVAAGPINGNTTVCKGSEATYTVPVISGATSYSWSLPIGATGNSTTNTITVVYGSSSLSGNITAKGHNECGEGTESTLAVTVNTIPVAVGPISGNTTVCKGSEATYTIPVISGATSYSWSLPTGATGNSTTNSITVTYGSSSVSGNITAKGHNECGDGTESSLAVTVNTIPVAAGPISGNTTVCKGSEATYTVTEISGATSYSWSLPAGATGNSTTNSITVTYGSSSVSGNITVKGHDGCGDGTESSLAISVNTIPVAAGPINGNTTVCKGSEATYSVPVISGATSYIWSLPTGATGNSKTNTITVTFGVSAVSGDITVRGENYCGKGNASTMAVTVNSVPAAASTITGTTAIVQGQSSVVYTVPTIPNAVSYIWTMPTGATGTSTTNSITVSYGVTAVSGEITVKGSNACGNSTASTLTITVNSVPFANAGPDQSVNEGVVVTLDGSASSDGDDNALSYKWSAPSGITLSSTTVAKPTFTAPEISANTSYTFSLTVNDGISDSPTDQVVITVRQVDKPPYVKIAIGDVSVEKGAADQVIDLKTIFADDDINDVLSYIITSNSNSQVVAATITGTNLTLNFSKTNIGTSDIVIKATSNGKEIGSPFKVEVKTPTGIDEISNDQGMRVYPNPTKGIVTIAFDKLPAKDSYLIVSDLNGKVLLRKPILDKEIKIDLSGHPYGFYVIKTNLPYSKVFKILLK